MLLAFFFLGLSTVLAKSPTVDESVHIARGQALWQTDDLGIQIQPPLSHWLMGSLLFLLPDDVEMTKLATWETYRRSLISYEFLWESGLDVAQVLLLARLPILFLGLLLGAVLARWANELWGRESQLLVLVLFAFSPNIIAFSGLATTDLTTAATFTFCLYAWWRFGQNRTWGSWLLAGVFLGLGVASKLTSILLLPLTFFLAYAQENRDRKWWQPGVTWLSLLPVAGLVIWGLYHWELRPLPTFNLPIPAATYLSNFLEAQSHIERGHATYLFGEQSTTGWWYYFLVAFLIKTPIPTLILLLVAIFLLAAQQRWRDTIYLWLPAGLLFAAASYSGLNIGYRHILPLLPFVWLLIAGSLSFWWQHRVIKAVLVLMLLWYFAGAVAQQPHYLPYFNELVGGSAQGYRYLGDSNVDWGQDLNLLADYLADVDDVDIFVSYFGPSDLAYYGLPTEPLFKDDGEILQFSPANPAPGLYGISVSHWQGMVLVEPDMFDWFRRQEPTVQLGYSIFVFEVDARAEGSWIAHCANPVPILDETQAAKLVNQPNARHVYFDCMNSWVFPEEGKSGWYILPLQDGIWPAFKQFPEQANLVYQHDNQVPGYAVYYWQGDDDFSAKVMAQSGDVQLDDGKLVDPPVTIANFANFLGYWQDAGRWATVWQANELTVEPLSVAGHLFSEGNVPLGVADGLGYSTVQWQAGDIFVQYHLFGSTEAESAVYLETGFYNYITGEPFMFGDDGRSVPRLRLFAK